MIFHDTGKEKRIALKPRKKPCPRPNGFLVLGFSALVRQLETIEKAR